MAYRRIPSLNWLRVFEAAARTESFTAAADILNMSPSAVSQQISALEGHLGQKLFQRDARRVKLSEAGALYLPTIHEALASIEDTTATLFANDRREKVIVHAVTIFAVGWLASRLPSFYAANPHISIDLHAVESLVPGGLPEADATIMFGHTAHRDGERTELFAEHLYPVARPAVAKQIKTPDDLCRFRLLQVNGHRQSWRLILSRLGLTEDADLTICNTSSTLLALAMAELDDAIAIARAPTTDPLLEKFGLVPCIEGFQIGGEGTYAMTTHPGMRSGEAVQRFRDWLIAESNS